MARRRVNFPLLVTIGGFLLVGSFGAIFYVKHFGRSLNPQRLIAAGDLAYQQGNYDQAAADLSAAGGMLPEDAPVHVKLGKALLMLGKAGKDTLSESITAFKTAEELDPSSKEAWGGLLETSELFVEHYENSPVHDLDKDALPRSINTAREAADRLVKLDPNSLDALVEQKSLVIRIWLLNLSMPEIHVKSPTGDAKDANAVAEDKVLTPEQQVNAAVLDLSKLMREHPESDRIPYWIARAKIKMATLAIAGDQPADAAGLFAEAASAFDASIAAKPDQIGLYLNKSAVIQQLQIADPNASSTAEYRDMLRETVEKAQSLADPKHPEQYLQAKQQWGIVLSSTDPARAEQVYRDVISKFPDEIGVRLLLARLLQHDASRRSDALAILDAIPSLPGSSVTTPEQRETWDRNVAISKLVRADIEVEQFALLPPGKARDKLAADIQRLLDAGNKIFVNKSGILKVRGKFELAMKDPVAAIATLTTATEDANGAADLELLQYLSVANQQAGQTGKAIELLERAIADPGLQNNAELHLRLAQLHLQNQEPARARPYVEWLTERFPANDPQIVPLQIATMPPGSDPKDIHAKYDTLAEKTPPEIRIKLGVAQEIGDRSEQTRLLEILNKQQPGDLDIAKPLIQLYIDSQRIPDAEKAIAAGVAANPEAKPDWDMVDEVVHNKGRKEIVGSELEIAGKIKDDFTRAMTLARIYESDQNTDDELVQLQKALAIQPANTDVQQQAFRLLMALGRFPQAEAMLPQMSDDNADKCHGMMLKSTLALAKHDIPTALAVTRQLTHDYSNFSGSFELYGEALAGNGQWELACQQFNTALQLQGTNVEAWKQLIRYSVLQGKLEDAKGYIKDARERYPADPDYLQMQVEFEISFGNPESLLPLLDQAIASHPKDRRYYAMSADALMSSMRYRAAKGDADGASNYLDKAKACFASAIQYWPDDLRFSNGLAQMALQNHDLAGAEQVMNAICQRPRWQGQARPQVLLARLYVGANNVDMAEKACNQALVDDPKSDEARLVLADCKILKDDPNDAILTLAPAIGNFEVLSKYVDLLVALNRGAEAEADLNTAIKADPANTALINLRLHVYDAEGRYQQGWRAADDALVADHTNVWAFFWRGKFEASGAKPDLDLAMKDLGFFRDSMPTEVKGRELIATILDAKGDRDGAIHELEAALVFAPQDREVRLALLRDYLSAAPPRTLEADSLLTKTIALPIFAQDPEFLAKSALISAQRGDSTKALAQIQSALKHARDKGELVHDYFNVLLVTKNYDLLITESNAYTGNPRTSWFVYNDRAIAEASLGRYSDADTDFRIALDRSAIEIGDAAAREIVNAICQCMNQEGKQTGVQKALEIVLPRADNSVHWKLIATDLYLGIKDIPDALKLIESALVSADALPVSDRMRLFGIANELYLKSIPPLPEKAMEICKRMLKINPGDANALNNVAYILCDMVIPARPQEALTYSQRAYDLDNAAGRSDPSLLDTHGWILIQVGQVEEGINVLDKVIDLEPNFPEAYYHLAIGYIKTQKPEEAQRQLDKAKEVIAKLQAQKAPVDPNLMPKIEDAAKQADQMKPPATPVTAAP